jgi:hypothetical protein
MAVKTPNVTISRKLKSPAVTPQAIFFLDPDCQSGDAAVRHGAGGESA